MKNINYVLILPLFSSTLCLAQKKQNVYSLKKNGESVKLKDRADYIRFNQEPDSGSKFFNLFEFYKDGSKNKIAKVSKFFDPNLIFEETAISRE